MQQDDLDTDDVQGVARRYRAIGRRAVPALVKAMRQDRRPRVRANAVTALDDVLYHESGGRESPEARTYLLEALRDPDPGVVARAAAALSARVPRDGEVRQALLGVRAVLAEATRSRDRIAQRHATLALGALSERPSAEGLLRSTDAELRRQGIAAAAQDPAALPALLEVARRDPDALVRLEAIPVAARLAPAAERDALLRELLADPESTLAGAAATAAGAQGATALASVLREILRQPADLRLVPALGALGALRDQEAVPLIVALLSDGRATVRSSCAAALNAILAPTPPRTYPEWVAWAQREGRAAPP